MEWLFVKRSIERAGVTSWKPDIGAILLKVQHVQLNMPGQVYFSVSLFKLHGKYAEQAWRNEEMFLAVSLKFVKEKEKVKQCSV